MACYRVFCGPSVGHNFLESMAGIAIFKKENAASYIFSLVGFTS
jgi:hypothetical protein